MRNLALIAAVASALALTGCGGGGSHLGPKTVIGQPASSHNQGGVNGLNFAWGEHEECPPGFHSVTTYENGVPTTSCVPNGPGGLSVKAQSNDGPLFPNYLAGQDGSPGNDLPPGYEWPGKSEAWPEPGSGEPASFFNLMIAPDDFNKALQQALPSIGDPSVQ